MTVDHALQKGPYWEYLAERSMTGSQFILITPIKRTMQLVDVLYGVTMPPCVSSWFCGDVASGKHGAGLSLIHISEPTRPY